MASISVAVLQLWELYVVMGCDQIETLSSDRMFKGLRKLGVLMLMSW